MPARITRVPRRVLALEEEEEEQKAVVALLVAGEE
jgi:hypothetical protein